MYHSECGEGRSARAIALTGCRQTSHRPPAAIGALTAVLRDRPTGQNQSLMSWAWVLTVAHLLAVLLIVVRNEYLAAWFVATMRLHPFLDDGSRGALARRPRVWALWAAGATVSCAVMLLLGVWA